MNKRVAGWFLFSVVIAGLLSLFASTHPDGYETAGAELGFIGKATSYFHAPIPDYSLPGTGSWGSSIAGVIGVCITFGVFYMIGKWIGRKPQ
ncbi:PDGLE domain-containing protein [Brevibacillus ginsengisoli]|uniref:PDGLE domain-containing protein n=1 Tax=Brevibacillus ginsengisoli TaxID=363854 RepID=UPI003CE6EA97